jgi:hypothetical protein
MKIKTHALVSVGVVAAAVLAMMAFLTNGSTQAQSPTVSPVVFASTEYPAYIYNGTCANLGSIAWNLNNVSLSGMTHATPNAATAKSTATPVFGTPIATPTVFTNGSPTSLGPVIAESDTQVKVHLSDLEKAPFAINVHASGDNFNTHLVCGEITGPINNGILAIPLNEVDHSGFAGAAVLKDNGDGTTSVTVQLTQLNATGK